MHDRNVKASLAASYNELVQSFTALSMETVGNYTLGRVCGEGSYGKCYLGRHKFVGTKVALKSTCKTEAANLAREIHHHRRLHHPNITQLYEVVITESKVWLVLEYCSRGELYEHLIAQKRLSVDETSRLFAQICGAVAYVHSRSVVHRDLKLENIFLDSKGNAKLGDFGFTRENDKSLLETYCGSMLYSSPEMLRGEKYKGEAVDVWSLGIILYALLVGSLPFDYDDDAMTKQAILKAEPVFPEHLSDTVTHLLRQLLDKDALNRPSAQEILSHPFLRGHASEQLSSLAQPYHPTFTTPMEGALLDRYEAAGFDIERMIKSVTDYRCDALCGFWWLAIQRELKLEKKLRRASQRRSTEVGDGELAARSMRSRSRSRSRQGDYRYSRGRHTPQRGSISSMNGILSESSFPDTVMEEIVGRSADATVHRKPSLDARSFLEHLKPTVKVKAKTVTVDGEERNKSSLEILRTESQARSSSPHSNKDLDGHSHHRKSSLVQAFKHWWSLQTKATKEKLSPKHSPRLATSARPAPPPAQQQQPPPEIRVSTTAKPVRDHGYSPASSRRSSFASAKVRSSSARPGSVRRRSGLMANMGGPSPIERTPSRQESSSSRPDVLRSVSYSSNHSSVPSISRGRTSHSKASSTSSNSTFTSSRSLNLTVRTPRTTLKVMPATPPPYMITHAGGRQTERNIFEQTLRHGGAAHAGAGPGSSHVTTPGAGNASHLSFATRKKRSAVLKREKPSGRRRISLAGADAIEEEEEEGEGEGEDGDGFVDEETFHSYPEDEPPHHARSAAAPGGAVETVYEEVEPEPAAIAARLKELAPRT